MRRSSIVGLELLKNPIKSNYIVTLSIVTLVIIFLATWFGLTLAKGITGPIQDLCRPRTGLQWEIWTAGLILRQTMKSGL